MGSIVLEIEGRIGIVKISRPKALNALNKEVFLELGERIDDIRTDEQIKVVIITGDGDKAFIAGTDVVEMQHLSVIGAKEYAKQAGVVIDKIDRLNKPVIAAINGFALGGGCEVALACDIRIASENAKLGFPEINFGIIPGSGGTQRLPRLIGISRAKELIFTGEIIDANEAFRIGLVNKVVSQGSLLDKAKAVASKIASKGRIALSLAKEAINKGVGVDLSTGLAYEIDCFSICFSTEDQKEGFSAFFEKRKPQFMDR